MSFESFIEEIEELAVLPSQEKQDGGYFYPEEMQGKLYRYRDMIMHISTTSTNEMPLPMIEAIYQALESGIVEDVRSAIAESSNNSDSDIISDRIETLENKLERLSDGFEDDIANLNNIASSNTRNLDMIEEKQSHGINLEMIQKIIDKKFDSVPARMGKIKISTLSMLKESGFSIDEISELAKNELI